MPKLQRTRGHHSPSSRWLPAVGESRGGRLRRRSGLGPQRRRRGDVLFKLQSEGGVPVGGGRAQGGRHLPPRTDPDSARVWLELGAEGVST